MSNQNTLTVTTQDLVRQSTDVAGLCKEIVVKSAMTIQGRKYVKVEGWQSIATAHGCIASSRDVERIEGGFRAIGEIRRMTDGAILATAEGFVGEDEPTWFGGTIGNKTLPKRADYAIRAMAQTRAISRACRSAFAHVVVLMDAGLSTTPAEEIPDEGFRDEPEDSGRVTNQPVPKTYWSLKEKNGERVASEWLDRTYGGKCGIRKTDDGWRVVMYDDKDTDGRSQPQPPASSPSKELAKSPRESSTQQTAHQEAEWEADGIPGLTMWRDVVVHVKSTLQNKRLGELQLSQLKVIYGWMQSQDWTQPHSKVDHKLKAAVFMGIAELEKPANHIDEDKEQQAKSTMHHQGTAPKEFPDESKTDDGRQGLLAKVRELMASAILVEEDLMTYAHKWKQCPKEAKGLDDIPNDYLEQYIEQWGLLMEAWGQKIPEAKATKKGAKK